MFVARDISFLYDAVNHTCTTKDQSTQPTETKPKVKLPTSVQKQLRDLGVENEEKKDEFFLTQEETPVCNVKHALII